jgi:translation initiation factor IF-2
VAAKVRAYKLAEELGIDRNEFVERAAAEGVELKNPMAALEPEQVDLLREKLGGQAVNRAAMDEHRVESKAGSTILRRRRKKAADLPPEPEPKLEPVPVAQVHGERVLGETAPEDASLEAVPEVEQELDEPVVEPLAGVQEPVASPAGGVAARKRPAAEEPPDRKGKQRKRVREVVNLREQEQVKLQYTGRGGMRRRTPVVSQRALVNPRSKRRDKLSVRPVAQAGGSQPKAIRVAGEISVGELAKLLGAKAPAIQGKLMALGIMVSVNQTVDIETCRKLAAEMSVEVQDTGFREEEYFESAVEEAGQPAAATLVSRSPVITVMGHVDHGKTSILDAIRKTRIVEGEAGGITQHIGAYQVEVRGANGASFLTFIDTPGHAAFTQMRARGAALTDMVVLVVAATEGVMPQTVEAIQHARAAGCPIVVAINKCDLPGANPQQIRQRLMEHELVAEDFGGDTIFVNVSAKTGQGLDQLLEMLSLQAEVLELRADPSLRASGVVIEASLSKGRGPVATVLVQEGTLHTGDVVVCDTEWGRVRTMENDKGERLEEAGPSVPVQVIGLSGVPGAGASFHVVESERVAKRIVDHREDQVRGRAATPAPKLTLEEFFARAGGEERKELPVILKADVQGTCEAVKDALEKMSTDAVSLRVISTGVGGISENDITFAKASDAIVVGFHSRPDPAARAAAEQQGIEIRTYTIIYELLDDVRAAMAGLLPPTVTEVLLGRAEVRQPFSIPRFGTIAGSYVTEGTMKRNAHCRLIRDGIQIYQGRIGSLRRFKDDASEVRTGFECGIGIDGYNDVKEGDVIEAFELKEEAATL